MRRILFPVVVVVLVVAGPASAQSGKDWWGNFAITYTEPMGDTADHVDGDYGFTGGFEWKPSASQFGLLTELSWNDFDAPSLWAEDAEGNDVLLEGHAEVWALTLSGTWHAPTEGKVGFYAVAGLGAYRRNVEVTTPAGYDWIYWCDPWWGYCWYEPVAVDAVLYDESTTKVGYNLGIGTTFKVGYSTELYLEARYHWVDTPEATEFIPIAFGIRF